MWFYRLTSLFLILLSLVSCAYDIDTKGGLKGNGSIEVEKRTVASAFEAIVVSEDLTVYVSQGDSLSIRVEADDNIMALIITDINSGELHVHTARNIGRATKKIYVSLPKISGLKSSKGAILQTQNTIKGDSLVLETSTGSILHADLWYKKVQLNSKEGSDLNLAGQAENTNITVSSGSRINAEEFKADNCRAKASYGGRIKLKVSKSLVADANTGGTIIYIGNPEVDKTKSLTGNVQKY